MAPVKPRRDPRRRRTVPYEFADLDPRDEVESITVERLNIPPREPSTTSAAPFDGELVLGDFTFTDEEPS